LRGPAAKLNKKNDDPIRLITISGMTSRSFVPYSSNGASEQKNSSQSIYSAIRRINTHVALKKVCSWNTLTYFVVNNLGK
jgi:hypothetical protein